MYEFNLNTFQLYIFNLCRSKTITAHFMKLIKYNEHFFKKKTEFRINYDR